MEPLNVFISRPNDLTDDQQQVWQELDGFIRKLGLTPRVIGSVDYPNVAPLRSVVEVMHHCDGAIILGFRHTLIEKGRFKAGTAKEQVMQDVYLPTPWNHMEAGMAYQLGLPLMIICEAGMTGGIFDIGTTERFIHQFDLSTTDWIDSERFLQPFTAWHREVVRHSDE